MNENSLKVNTEPVVLPEPTQDTSTLKTTVHPSGNPFMRTYEYFFNNQKRKSYSLLTLTFLFITILIAFAIYPTFTSIATIWKKIEDYQILETKQITKIDALKKLENQTANSISNGGLNEYVDFLDQTFIPSSIKEEDVYKDIFDKSTGNNISILSIKTLDSSTDSLSFDVPYKRFQVNLQSKDLDKLKTFINNINNSKKLYLIEKVDYTSPDRLINPSKKFLNDSADYYSASLTFISYFYE